MPKLKVGIRLESLGVSLRRGLLEAQRLGVSGVQVDAVGDLAPDALSQTGRREFRNLLRAHNLDLTALGCPLRHGLDVAVNQEARIDHIRKVLSLSFDLGPRIAIVQAGQLPDTPDDPSAGPLTEALLALGHHGDRVGAVLALETGLESGETIQKFLSPLDTGGLGVNFDPANLLMNGFDPYEAARALDGRIVHVHAKDARRAGASRTAREVPLGHGDLEWMRLLGDLEQIEYRGWLTIEQEAGDNRLADVTAGVAFLRRLLP
ncbi:MAG TPA: sugar phosphate isomerase/epimerase family protein [Gemmataceae bacterium]|nr:sugar phosphate isomerase/epimerase family protein [Gemmataceae bacterium]